MSNIYNKHLSLKDRKSIEAALQKGASRTSITQPLGKNKSTICKEVKSRRYVVVRGYDKGVIRDCIHLNKCGYKFCTKPCVDYQMIRCSYRDRKAGVCNGCDSFIKCNETKYLYKAQKVHDEYRTDLVNSREGIHLTTSQAKQLGDFLKPLVDNG